MGALRLRRACALLACGATLLLNVWRLVARQGDAPEAAAACALARQLELALPSPPSETGSDTAAELHTYAAPFFTLAASDEAAEL